MLHAAVDRPEGREQPDPGIVPAFEHFLAVLVGRFLQLGHEGRDGVVLVVERVAQEQQFPLLGGEQEHQPHHDRQGGLVEVGLGDARPAVARPWSWSARSSDWMMHLDGLADLIAKLVGDFLLVRGALLEHRLERLVVGHAEEAVDAEQAAEGPQRDRLLEPEGRVPGGEAGRLPLRGIDQHPVVRRW